MNKKGFTLIELIAVITILGIIALITVPIMYNSIKGAKEKMYEEQKLRIVDVAKKYALENESAVVTDFERDYTQIITLTELKQQNYLEQKDIINPITDEVMDGCILVSYTLSSDKFTYEYVSSCSFGRYYTNSSDLYYYHTKEPAGEVTLGVIMADADVSFDSNYINSNIKIYDDGNGYLFDKDEKTLTFYVGMMWEADDISTLLELYRVIQNQASSGGDGEFSDAFSHYDIYIDASQNIMIMVVDVIKTFDMEAALSQRFIEELTMDRVSSIESICDSVFKDIDDCNETIALKHIKLDN